MTREEMQELKRLAESATPGPWEHAEVGGFMVLAGPTKYNAPGRVSGGRGLICEMDDDCFHDDQQECNAEFIAAANPQAVLALIARIEELEGK